MNRLLTFLIAILYLVMSTGFVVNSHYCMGKLSSVEIGRPEVKKCICGMRINYAKKSKCCHSQTDVVKLSDVHKLTAASGSIHSFFVVPILYFYRASFPVYLLYNTSLYLKKAPPNLYKEDTYLQIGVFRI